MSNKVNLNEIFYDMNTHTWRFADDLAKKTVAEAQVDEDEKILNAIDDAALLNDATAIDAALDKLEEKMTAGYTFTSPKFVGGIGGTVTISSGNGGIASGATFTTTSNKGTLYVPGNYSYSTNWTGWSYSTYDGYAQSYRSNPAAKKLCSEREIQEYKGKK